MWVRARVRANTVGVVVRVIMIGVRVRKVASLAIQRDLEATDVHVGAVRVSVRVRVRVRVKVGVRVRVRVGVRVGVRVRVSGIVVGVRKIASLAGQMRLSTSTDAHQVDITHVYLSVFMDMPT